MLILRILAQRKNIPEGLKFLSFDAETQMCLSSYVSPGEICLVHTVYSNALYIQFYII